MLLSVGLSIISGGDFLWPSRVRRGAFQEEKKFRLEKIDFFFANKKNFFGVLNLFGFFREIMCVVVLLIFVSFVSCFFPPVASHCVFSRPFSGQLRVFFFVSFEYSRDFRYQWIIRIGITQEGAN